jgi:GNAT superfamily N-acetyltransferase
MNHLRAQWRTARNIKGKDWYEHKDADGEYEVFDPWWDSQHEQYPLKGSPNKIVYFKGEIDAKRHVDCLLYYDKDGDLVGILNYFPQDMPPHQKKGDSLTVVAPGMQRKGIGTKLLGEALKRWPDMNLHQAENTPAGNALVRSIGR